MEPTIILIGIAIFTIFTTYTITKDSQKNQRYIVDKEYFINKDIFLKKIGFHISNHLSQLGKQDININYQLIDQQFLKANLTHINLKDFQYYVNQTDIEFEHQNNTILIMVPIQQFDLIVHFELWNIFTNSSQQINFRFRVKDLQIGLRYKINGLKIEFVDKWFPKFKFGQFEFVDDDDEENAKYSKTKQIIDWLLYKFHKNIEKSVVLNLMKSFQLSQLNVNSWDFNSNKNVKNLRVLNNEYLSITVNQYNDEILMIEDLFEEKQN
ncbi:unnamed protein product [Paramecium octaurelia]|uniref:Transmembrane protein n=1 Tax=Paramecium octaurelia TaxID=43137 RepID=A0A8S1UQL6_PAROT|nr:unnamed protein product [Paramecium octaurelia]